MAKIDDGGQAFPRQVDWAPVAHNGVDYDGSLGMTLADWFAGQAILALSFHPEWWRSTSVEGVACAAYEHADAMIAEKLRRESEQ